MLEFFSQQTKEPSCGAGCSLRTCRVSVCSYLLRGAVKLLRWGHLCRSSAGFAILAGLGWGTVGIHRPGGMEWGGAGWKRKGTYGIAECKSATELILPLSHFIDEET